MAVETVFSVWVVGFLLETWPDPPWGFFQFSTAALDGGHPHPAPSPDPKTLFLAFDLLTRPPYEGDFAAPHEPSPHIRRANPQPRDWAQQLLQPGQQLLRREGLRR